MKNRLIEKINSVYTQIEASEKELNKDLKAASVDRVNNLQKGTKVLSLQEQTIELFKLIEIYIDIAEGKLEELPENVINYYNLYNTLRKEISEADPEEIKKMKEFINSFKSEKKDGN